MKIYITLMIIFAVSGIASAQKVSGTVKGILQDSASATLLSDATVSVMSLPDSSLISFTLTRSNGYFEIKNLAAGEYLLLASFTGLQAYKKSFVISAEKATADFATIKMDRAYKNMQEVVITDQSPVHISGDTIGFNANMFKTKPNATVEDLLKKLPGMQVDKDGTVKAQGETVQKVYVDGKEFFNNDPKLATKNLSADMIDEVQVFDDMSEQAKFNKIDDGSRSKALNLKLKKDKKKGIFGKAYAGYGSDQRYDAGLNTNFFKGATQTSVIAKTNNTNNIGFTISDMLGMFNSGGGMMSGGMGGNSGGAFGGGGMGGGSGFSGGMGGMNMIRVGGGGGSSLGGFNLGSTGGGITTSSQAGINYRDTWSKHFDVNGSYFFNHAQTQNQQTSFRQNFATDSTINSTDKTYSLNRNNNHRANLNMVYTIDSFNSIIYQPNINFQNSGSFSDDTLNSNVLKNGNSYKTNESRTISNTMGDGYNFSNNLIWRKRFRRPGRTLSVNVSNTWSDNNRDAYSTINSKYYNNSGIKFLDRMQDFVTRSKSNTDNYNAGLSYTEAIARDKIMEFNYNHTDNHTTSDRKTFNRNLGNGAYDVAVDSLTNLFDNSNVYDRIGTNFRVVKKKYNYQLGFAVQQTTLESNNRSKNTAPILQKTTNLFPTASFNYQFQRSRSLRISYRGRTNQPTASQLQDVIDYTNYPYLTKGNPALTQEFAHSVLLSYNFFDIMKFRNVFAFVTYNVTQNKIVNAIQNLPGGVQLTMPVNMNGVYNVTGNFNIGFPIKQMRGGNFNTTTRVGYSQDASLIDRAKNLTRNLSLGEDLRLSYNKDKLDLGAAASISYNQVKYTVQQRNNTAYFTHVYSADATYTLPKNFIFSTDIDWTFNTGRTDGFNQNYAIWNASFARQVFKNKRGELKASVNDILNQNKSVYRTVSDNYVQDVQNNVIKRYFMLTFTYNINRMGGRSMPPMMERATKGIRIN